MRSRLKGIALLAGWEEARRKGIGRAEFASQLGIPPKTLDSRLYDAKNKADKEFHDKYGADVFDIDLGDPWSLSGDYCIVGDVHVPTTDFGMAMLASKVAKKMGVKRMLIGGDLFNFDVLGAYAHIVAPPTGNQEIKSARALVNEWLETFESIEWIMGNHDRRWQKWALTIFEEADLAALVKADPSKFRLSPYGWCELNSGGVEWVVMHQRNYSINQLNVADAMAAQTRKNVVTFHEHHLAIGWDRYGHNVVVNGGCLADGDNVAYKRLDLSKHASWKKGFVIMKNGCPYLFGESPFTDWDLWLD